MLKSIFCGSLLTLCATQALDAQKKPAPATTAITRESLLSNPNILWIGEAQSVILLDANTQQMEDPKYLEARGIKGLKRVTAATIKLVDINKISSSPYDEEINALNLKLVNSAFFAKNEVYEDAACTQKIANPKQRISRVDTLNVGGEKVVMVNDTDPRDIKSFQINHLVYFDQKANAFGNLVTAFAPIFETTDPKTQAVSSKPLFWIKMENSKTLKDLYNKDLTWAKRSSRNLTFADFKPLKTSKTVEECLQIQMDFITKNAKTVDIRGTMGQLDKLNPAEIAKIAASVDTIITFDPKTFQEVVQVMNHKFDPKNVQKIRLLQDWYWDEKLQKLSTHTSFYAPIINRNDDTGKFINEGPMYWAPASN
jgi:Gliding motility associated protein GldN